MTPSVHHPVFARLYARMSVSASAERRGQALHRDKLLSGLAGRVLEVGAGNGLNFAHYPRSVEEVVALEPEAHLRDLAAKAAGSSPVPVRVVDGTAEHLEADEASFDAGVVSLVLCSVSDQRAALGELFRVIRAGGELRFYEHVIAHRPEMARFQRIADATVWPRISGGCHLARDTVSGIEQAGFEVRSCERFAFTPMRTPPPIPHVIGVARRP